MLRTCLGLCLMASVAVALGCSGEASTAPIVRPELLTTVGYACPEPFSLTTDFIFGDPTADKNGDGYACLIEMVGGPGGKERIPSYVDNRVPIRVGGCPDGFAVLEVVGNPLDRNGDNTLCGGTRPNGDYVLVDNNY